MAHWGLFVLALGLFTSISFMALSHVLLGLSGVYFFYVYLKEKGFQIPLKMWGLVAVWVTVVLSILFNWGDLPEPGFNLSKSKYFIIGIFSFFSVRYCCKEYLDVRRIRLLLNTFMVTTTVASISGLIALWTGYNPLKFAPACDANRACGMFGMLMTYGYGLSFFLLIVAGLLLYRKSTGEYFNRNIALVALVVNTAGLFLSYTRGAWLGLVVALPFFFFKKNKKLFLISGLAGVLLLGGVVLVSPGARQAFFDRSESNTQRLALYRTAVKAFIEKPYFGYGYRNFEPNTLAIKARYDLPHPDHPGHGPQ